MAYTKTVHKDRQVQYPNRYVDQESNQYTFTRDEGTVTEEGTLVNATVLNNMEDGIEDAHTVLGTTSATEIGYVKGVTSAIQTQLNAKSTVYAGSFTPQLWDGQNSPTYTYQEGFYYTAGSLCFVEIYIAISSKGSCSGTIRLGDLPFNSSGVSARILQGLQVVYATGITYPAGISQLCFGGPRSTNYMALYGNGTSPRQITFDDIADITTIRITGVYRY